MVKQLQSRLCLFNPFYGDYKSQVNTTKSNFSRAAGILNTGSPAPSPGTEVPKKESLAANILYM